MVLDSIKAVELIKKHSKPCSWIIKAREYHTKLNALVNGVEFAKELVHIEHIESKDKAEARKKYARSIKHFNERLLRPVNNVYSATGGSKEYKIAGDVPKKDVLSAISNIRDGKSLEDWLKTHWIKSLYHSDPNGLIFMEWNEDKCYPTYKSIASIRYYEAKGQNIDYVIFEPEKTTIKALEEKYQVEIPSTDKDKTYDLWRVVDEKTDYKFIDNNGTFVLVLEIGHLFGICPGVINSDIYDFERNIRISPIDSIIDLEQEYLRDQSIKTIYKFKHGFPLHWRYAMVCTNCKGKGTVNNDVCPECNGKGELRRKDVTDEAILPIPQASDAVKLAPDIAGFSAPDLATWQKYTDELKLLFDTAYETHWGTLFVQEQNQTATGKFIDTQPIINKLNDYADVAQYMEQQLTEMVANFKVPTRNKTEKASFISYGRNYLIESPDAILERYQTAKEKGSPVTILDRLLIEFITTKFKTDPENLRINLVKKEIEPYVHFDINTVKDVYGVREAQKKSLFVDWWETVTFEIIKKKTVEQLTADFNAYIETNLGTQTETIPLAIKLGVGGTQALQSILADPNLSYDSKKASLVILFGLTEDQANQMTSEPAQPNNNTV